MMFEFLRGLIITITIAVRSGNLMATTAFTPVSSICREAAKNPNGVQNFATLFSSSPTILDGSFPSSTPAWYTDSNLSRSEIPITDEKSIEESRFVFIQKGERGTNHLYLEEVEHEGESSASPLFLNFEQVEGILGKELSSNLVEKSDDGSLLLLWIGERSGVQYFAIYEPIENENTVSTCSAQLALKDTHPNLEPKLAPLREFGDRIPFSIDSAIHSTANALVEFHNSHRFCSYCGNATSIRKYGASRICSDHKSTGGNCRSPSIYPRIDLASIMLVTSPCDNYCLLGRKSTWPKGRYSTLAGFLEVGETIEHCCVRETFEESGVMIERDSVKFVRSQPWPFPRSLMAGFRARAARNGKEENKNELPEINVDEKEMEDVRWFHRDYVVQRLGGGSTALLYEPAEEEREFHIPGKASLARLLITEWALEKTTD